MSQDTRKIRPQELALIEHLLGLVGFTTEQYPVREDVVEYEDGKMGSISVGEDPNLYDGDLIQVEYVDSDGTPVLITLTKDSNNKLLDLDFWKVDFSKLITYPQPHQVSIRPLDAGV